MTDIAPLSKRGAPTRAIILALTLFVVEIGAIGIIFKHGIEFTCLKNWPPVACSGASRVLVSVYCIMGALALLMLLNPEPFRRLLDRAGERTWPLALNIVGVGVALIPISFMQEGAGRAVLLPAYLFWSVGMVLLLGGLLGYLAPLSRWRVFVAENWTRLLPMLTAGAAAPYIAILIHPLWSLEFMAGATFRAVAWALVALGYSPDIDVTRKIIGTDEFSVNVAPVCSGIEGMTLVTLFVTLYLALFRSELRFPQALLLYPVGLVTSVLFNVLRITVLLVIGIEGNPELAVGGFHSHAGWLLFTLIAMGIVLAARSVPALQKHSASEVGASLAPQVPPFFRDPVVARILPFAVFMFSALLVQAFSNSPGVVYPLRAAAMAAVLAVFWPIYTRLDWRLDPVALGAGVVIGLGWVLIPYAPEDTTPAHGALTGAALVGWLLARGIGTILLVPIIEELFFRDYLESRLRPLGGPVLAALVTAVLFAFLHDRWAEAFVAGLIFSWVMWRQGRVTDAIVAHAIANLIVFAVALTTGQMHII